MPWWASVGRRLGGVWWVVLAGFVFGVVAGCRGVRAGVVRVLGGR